METERGSLGPRDVDNPKKEVQLRVIPSELKFLDAVSGKVYRLPLTVHNLGRWNQKMRFQEPVKPQFKLLLTSLDKELASGLQMTAMVEYHPDKNEDMFDHMFISVGNKVLDIPLVGLIPTCQLEIVPVVDFGTLVANSKVHCKEISIINHGKAPGTFKTEYQGQLPIVISPSSGTVKAKSSMVIKVDFCADQSQFVNEEARVSLQGRPDTFLNIKVHVVEQIIELFNMNSDRKLECIRFGSVFFGTSKIEQAVLFNNSPETINWVAIMQDDCVGEELNVICSFVPHQIGVFKVKQVIEIIGPVADENLRSLSMKPFHYINLEFNSVCKAYTKKVGVKINPGVEEEWRLLSRGKHPSDKYSNSITWIWALLILIAHWNVKSPGSQDLVLRKRESLYFKCMEEIL
ncbi:putative gene 7173 [Cricetulus griseus]